MTLSEELIMIFSSNPERFAGVLLRTSFIQDDVLLKMSSDDKPIGKATILAEAVIKKLGIAPEKLIELLKIISENYRDGLLSTSTYQSEFDDKYVVFSRY
jgi:hypothetical protein